GLSLKTLYSFKFRPLSNKSIIKARAEKACEKSSNINGSTKFKIGPSRRPRNNKRIMSGIPVVLKKKLLKKPRTIIKPRSVNIPISSMAISI
ncbi:MAG: hypothetical protein COY38_02490, partial [Candidatus Aenigmarchaeota archaeon CG_4_10_14_0_8_um_filter_37_24]